MNTNAADYSFRYTDLVEIKTEKEREREGQKKNPFVILLFGNEIVCFKVINLSNIISFRSLNETKMV